MKNPRHKAGASRAFYGPLLETNVRHPGTRPGH